jgi:hypothetical protein
MPVDLKLTDAWAITHKRTPPAEQVVQVSLPRPGGPVTVAAARFLAERRGPSAKRSDKPRKTIDLSPCG